MFHLFADSCLCGSEILLIAKLKPGANAISCCQNVCYQSITWNEEPLFEAQWKFRPRAIRFSKGTVKELDKVFNLFWHLNLFRATSWMNINSPDRFVWWLFRKCLFELNRGWRSPALLSINLLKCLSMDGLIACAMGFSDIILRRERLPKLNIWFGKLSVFA